MTSAPVRVALAIGDPNGIGPEIAVKTAAALAAVPGPRATLVGDEAVIAHYARVHAPQLQLRRFEPGRPAASGELELLPVAALPGSAFAPGTLSAEAGAATLRYARAAIDHVLAGHAAAVVACPHTEQAVNAACIRFAGYPGWLGEQFGVPAERMFLMLIGGGLRIVHVTLHERLASALQALDVERVEAAGQAAHVALQAMGIDRPRIGVFGINPHAGENGLFGDDDARITVPAAERLRAQGIDAVGPVGADLLLSGEPLDAHIAMYHDQGHIPIKLLAGRRSAAASLGAGVAFASVGHGSALDIAGRGVADPAPLLQSVRLLAGADVPVQESP